MSLASLSAHLSSIKTAFPPIVSEALFALGLASAAVWTLRPLLTIASRLFGPLFRRKPYKAGDWAVVTGASDGIGEALAMTLAKRGLNVMLIARSKEKLMKVQAAILAATAAASTKVQVAVHVADFSKLDIYSDIEKGELAAVCLIIVWCRQACASMIRYIICYIWGGRLFTLLRFRNTPPSFPLPFPS